MSVKFESVRFGTIEVPDEQVLEFPFGLIGLGGHGYALVDRNPGSGFLWLHSTEEPALALPVVRPHQFFADFELVMSEEDQQRTGVSDTAAALMYVTVRAAADPLQTTANLRAPIVVNDGRGFQVLNGAADAPLQAPLFELAEPAAQPSLASADAA